MYGDVSGAELAGRRGGGEAVPYPFLKIEKIALIIWKKNVYRNALILRNLP